MIFKRDSKAAGRGGDAIDNNETAGYFRKARLHGTAAASAYSSNLALYLRVGRAVQPHPRPTSWHSNIQHLMLFISYKTYLVPPRTRMFEWLTRCIERGIRTYSAAVSALQTDQVLFGA